MGPAFLFLKRYDSHGLIAAGLTALRPLLAVRYAESQFETADFDLVFCAGLMVNSLSAFLSRSLGPSLAYFERFMTGILPAGSSIGREPMSRANMQRRAQSLIEPTPLHDRAFVALEKHRVWERIFEAKRFEDRFPVRQQIDILLTEIRNFSLHLCYSADLKAQLACVDEHVPRTRAMLKMVFDEVERAKKLEAETAKVQKKVAAVREHLRRHPPLSFLECYLTAATAILLALALMPLNPHYLSIFRIAIFSVASFLVFRLRGSRGGDGLIKFCLLLTAGLFNPFVPVHIDRTLWTLLDLGCVFLFWVIYRDEIERYRLRATIRRARGRS